MFAIGKEAAGSMAVSGAVRGRLEARTLEFMLEKSYETLSISRSGLTMREMWLWDNRYLLRERGMQAAEALRRAGALPACGSRPRICMLAERYAAAVGGIVTAESLTAFLRGCRAAEPLSEKELSLFFPALTGALVSLALSQKEDAQEQLTGNAVNSLRALQRMDAGEILEAASVIEQLFLEEPAGIYPQMDKESRRRCREQVSELARARGTSEAQAAEAVLQEAQSRGLCVSQVLFPEKRQGPWGYLACLFGSTVLALVTIWLLLGSIWAAALLVFPVFEGVKRLCDRALVRSAKAGYLQRLELSQGVPDRGRTLCVISALAASEKEAESLARDLEAYRLCNRDGGPNLFFGLMIDLPEAATAETAEDGAVIGALKREIQALNTRYGGGFSLYLRPRVLSADSGRHMGRERKRGAILGLLRHLRGLQTEVYCAGGETPRDVRYLITLDRDTRLTIGSAKKLIGIALHPVNVCKTEKGRVVSGRGVLQPRVAVELESAGKTDYTRIFAGPGGRDPYGGVSSDLYEDVFGAASFTGKGLLDIDACLAVLDGAFPRERVLSHDLLEGEYLHCGFAGDVEVTDGWPKTILGEYSRLHRWVRGDWQTLPWLGKQVENEEGRLVENPISPLGKWKIFDNLRRSLLPGFTLLCIAVGMFSASPAFRAGAAIAGWIWGAGSLRLGFFRVRHLSGALDETARGICGFGMKLLLLPAEALVCLSAAITALWRMYGSHRGLLDWVTSAQSESGKPGGLWQHIWKLWPCVALGVAAVLFAPGIAKTAGILWLAAPLCAWALDQPRARKEQLWPSERQWLRQAAEAMWRYFREFVTPEEHDLPPDHYQEQPKGELAHRTSPTNLGLALLAGACAERLSLAGRQEALDYTRRLLGATERLEKKNGHLYNWYDTETARPLEPRMISSVDSGNLACCLIAVKGWLTELGAGELAQRAGALAENMRFDWLYDREKKLLYIGWDCERDAPTEGWYDLLSSEARGASYLAVARGDIPAEHWKALGRSPAVIGPYCGTISWTGTMFEYLMPELWLPAYEGSLLGESRALCLYAQKKRGPRGTPWGVSESAYYAFDRALGYCYKANGVQALAMKPGMEADFVLAPYASFLAMTVSPRQAVENLRRLEEMGAAGKYGFYDAIDLTPNRRGGAEFRVARTWMVHHLGMSLAAAANVLEENCVVNWFCKEPAMAAFRELLQERPPEGVRPVWKPGEAAGEMLARPAAHGWQRECAVDPMDPACTLLSNGAYSVAFCATGQSRSVIDGLAVTAFDGERMGARAGISAVFCRGSDTRPIAPVYHTGGAIPPRAELSLQTGALMTEDEALTACFSVSVPEAEPGELREVELTAKKEALEGELRWQLEPVLMPWREYEAHPAFARLMLTAMPLPNGALVRRRARGKRRDVYLCVLSNLSCEVSLERERNGTLHPGVRGGVPDACITLRVPMKAEAGEVVRARLALGISQDPYQAAETAKRILAWKPGEDVLFPEWEAQRLGMGQEELEAAMEGLSDLIFPPARYRETQTSQEGRQGLWSLGVSGNLPILSGEIAEEEDIPTGERLIRRHGLYAACGVENDLVLLVGDGGEYHRPLTARLRRYLESLGMEWESGAGGGVYLADSSLPGAAAIILRHMGEKSLPTAAEMPEKQLTGNQDEPLSWGTAPDGTISFLVAGQLPGHVWSSPLTGEKLSCIAADTGMGHVWLENARERQITPWVNDPAGTVGPETLELVTKEGVVSLFAAADGYPCQVRFGFGFASWEKQIGPVKSLLTMFVHPQKAARLIRLELSGSPGEASIRWCNRLVLGSGDTASGIVTRSENGMLTAVQTDGAFPEAIRFLSDAPPVHLCGVWEDWQAKNGSFRTGTGMQPCAGFVLPARSMTLIIGCEEREVLEALSANWQGVLEAAKAHWHGFADRLQVSTGERNLDAYLNGWALYQTVACRMEGRASMYQCGGAFGFRDQLQDACAIIPFDPEKAKRHILYAAAHQFEEGDVLHWWHEEPDGLRGVRTRCSDDLLWLPYVLCRYAKQTGECGIFRETAAFLSAPVLASGEEERYALVEAEGDGDLLEHARRAVLLVLRRGRGPHGLLLMGSGDWNDGMNAVNGESTWLTWFAVAVMQAMAEAMENLGIPAEGKSLRQIAGELCRAAEETWQGDRYLRGYYADGTPMGAPGDPECALDSIAQSFAVFAGADRARCEIALTTALDMLYTKENRLVRLLTPPFDHGKQSPGYIKSYAPGYRENGGQYTHGAVWLAMALLRAGRVDEGYEILKALLPGGRDLERYKGEPFVLAADVYAAPEHAGMAGWSWYTGAAGWYLQAAMLFLGIRLEGGKLLVEPKLPAGITGYRARVQLMGKTWRIRVRKTQEMSSQNEESVL